MYGDVHAALRRVAEDSRQVERELVFLFTDVMVNQLYRDLGIASMAASSETEPGFSPGKTKQLIRLSARLARHRALHDRWRQLVTRQQGNRVPNDVWITTTPRGAGARRGRPAARDRGDPRPRRHTISTPTRSL
jgi:hypothetical protein